MASLPLVFYHFGDLLVPPDRDWKGISLETQPKTGVSAETITVEVGPSWTMSHDQP